MNVLISAYAISPSWGSEQGMGWNWVINIAKYCNVFVITESEFKEDIEMALECLPQRNHLHFHYNPVSDRVRQMCWNQGNWMFYLHYRRWQKSTLHLARRIVRDNHIDVIHQLNMIGFREPGYLWKIKGIPFVWGPIGGCELMPMAMLRTESFPVRASVFIKNGINHLQSRHSYRVRKAINSSQCVIAAVQAAYELAKNYYRHSNVLLINETGLDSERPPHELSEARSNSTLQLLWVGKFDVRNKHDIALRTMSYLKGENIHLTIAGSGNKAQVARYKHLSASLGLSDSVSWLGRIPNSEIPALMQDSDLFFMTSIMEASSTVISEAIGSNLPILCFNACGFGKLVSGRVGETIEITDYHTACKEFAEKIRYLSSHRETLSHYALACNESKKELLWDTKARRILEIYSGCCDKQNDRNPSKYFHINYEFIPSRALQRIDESVNGNRPCYICVADGNILQLVHRDPEYRKVINGAMFSICDSGWVPLYLKKLHGIEVSQYCGSRIFMDIVSSRKYRQCFLGSTQKVLEGLKTKLKEIDPATGSMLFMELPFCDNGEFDYAGIAEQVKASGTDIIWVSLGAPKQEFFAARLSQHLDRGVLIPVGAVFNFVSGIGSKRAPEWMIRCHLEFLYRILQEPHKQIRRCLDIVTSLPAIIMEEKRSR